MKPYALTTDCSLRFGDIEAIFTIDPESTAGLPSISKEQKHREELIRPELDTLSELTYKKGYEIMEPISENLTRVKKQKIA